MTGRCPLRALLIKGRVRTVLRNRGNGLAALIADFCNKIGTTRTLANAAACPLLVEADIRALRGHSGSRDTPRLPSPAFHTLSILNELISGGFTGFERAEPYLIIASRLIMHEPRYK